MVPPKGNEQKSLEEFEQENMEQLQARDKKKQKDVKPKGSAKAKGKSKPGVLKRPAAHSKSGAPKAKAKTADSGTSSLEKRGCSKCRADGCTKCRNPGFTGKIWLKSEYLAYAKLHNLK